MVRKYNTPEYLHRGNVYQFYCLLFLSMEVGVAFNAVSWHSDHGERCRENHDADEETK